MSDSDDETKPDMTRIEDLSEFLHEDDPETDAQLDTSAMDGEDEPPAFETMSLDDLEDDESSSEDTSEEEPPAFDSADDLDSDGEEDSSWGDDSGESDWGGSGDATQPEIEVPAEFGSEEDSFASDDDSFGADDSEETLEEVQEIEEEAQLQEEVENEIEEAMAADTDDENDFSGDSFEETSFSDSDDDDTFGESSFSEDEAEEEQSFSEPEEEAEESFDSAQEEEIEQESFSEPEPELEPEPAPAPEPTPEFYQEPVQTQAPAPTKRENFQDVNEFGNSISYGNVAAGGNPPFSIILRKIKYVEDSERIIEILREHGLCDDGNESDFRQGLNNGSMLVSQLSEYSAIYLAHKFRRFDLEILVGLADEIHPSKNYDMDYKGLVRKENLRQNKAETLSLEDQVIEIDSILLATTPTLENYRIDRYLGLVSTHVLIDEKEFQKLQEADTGNIDPDELLAEIEEEIAAEEKSTTAHVEVGLEEIYQNLAEALKAKAFKLRGNAVVGINYQITPLIGQASADSAPGIRYKISCTGNAVWVGGKEAPRSEA